MADKLADYRAGRSAGIELALKEARENGVEGLEKLMKFYGAANIPPVLVKKDLDSSCETIKTITIDTLLLGSCAVLRDKFGFGADRLKRFIDGFNFLSHHLTNSWLDWWDIISELKDQCGLDLTVHNGAYHIVDAKNKDKDGEAPPVDKDWENVLAGLGFTEIENPPGTNAYDIADDSGKYYWRRENPEDKERLLYYFWGLLDGRRGFNDSEEAGE